MEEVIETFISKKLNCSKDKAKEIGDATKDRKKYVGMLKLLHFNLKDYI